MHSQTYLSPAKVNLTLSITGQDERGYHQLDSLVVFSSIGDDITLTPTEDGMISLTIDGDYGVGLPTDDSNLMMGAVRAIQAYAIETGQGQPNRGITMHLRKNLPVASGIGGGSANCATVLEKLPLLWRVAITETDMKQIALELGADVPVCMMGQTLRMQGIGEILSPILPEQDGLGMVLVNAGIPVETPPVFKAYQSMRQTGAVSYRTIADDWDISPLDLLHAMHTGGNDLTAPAVSLYPMIADVLGVLETIDGVVASGMSGSGGTCVALCTDEPTAQRVASAIKSQYNNWWVASGAIL